jgi:general secretion pathway protein E
VSLLDYLAATQAVTSADLERAERLAAQSSLSIVDSIRRLGVMDGQGIARAVSDHYRLPLAAGLEWPRTLEFAGNLSKSYLREHKVLPIAIGADDALVVVVADPANAVAFDALRLATRRRLEIRVAPIDEIEAAIDRLMSDEVLPSEGETAEVAAEAGDDLEQLKDLALGAPVIRIVNQLLVDALRTRATDVHIEPTRARLIVRYRIDGMLKEVRSPPNELGRAIVSRIKILSGLDIAERRLPQDGRARVRLDGRQLDLRVATVPTVHGESVAIRLLENAQRSLDLSQLGFDEEGQDMVRRHLAAPYGLVLVTGPTGSGKTTTLAAMLTILNEPVRKILTIEDPVEYQIDGINQIQVKSEIGLTFAAMLRSFLRNDPDVIMVGELRDTETARIAVQAALTGHLVLSTLHTNSAAGAVSRLLDMGVEGFLLASSLRCVIGQRLLRSLCPACRQRVEEPIALPPDVLQMAGLEPGRPHPHWHAKGCERCSGSGYQGRTGIVEIFEFGEELQRLVRPGVTTREIAAAGIDAGLRTMAVDGLRKCLAGVTTPDEVRRVVLES